MAFIEASIFWHFDLKHHIHIKIDALEYAIDEVLSQMILSHSNQLFFNYVTYKNLDPISSKSKIG